MQARAPRRQQEHREVVRAIPPERMLRRELTARGWTQVDLATRMGRPIQAVNEIMQGKKRITAQTALELAKVLGTSPDLWLMLDMHYQLAKAAGE